MKIIKNIFSKLLYGLLVIVLVCITVSSIIFLGEVDPTRMSFGQRSDEATVEAKRQELGLDLSLKSQLFAYLANISPIQCADNEMLRKYSFTPLYHFSDKTLILKKPYLGESYQTGRPVAEMISEVFPLTLTLALVSFMIALSIGLFLGIIAAINYGTWLDHFILSITTLAYSLPSYVVAIIFAIVFAYYLYPITGLNIQGSIFEVDDLGNDIIVWKNLILPALSLGIRPLAVITQITRSSVLDIISKDYIRTAKSKGLTKAKVIQKHVIKNSLNPIGTAVSGWLASLLAGAFFVETVFNFRGLGSLTVNGLLNYDVPVILGCILFTSVIFVIINILTDLFYLVIDPKSNN